MKRFSATLSLVLFCACFAPLVLAPQALVARTHAAKSHAAKSRVAKPATSQVAGAASVPLPDRNPNRPAAAPEAASADATAEATGSTADLPLPERNPKQPSPSAVPAAKPEGQGVDIPSPDRNPGRSSSTPPVTMQGSASSTPAVDFASILKPLLAYELSAADQANLKDALGASYKGDGNAAQAAIARIKDQAARKLATWYAYKGGGIGAPADAIEQFRNANPDWPGQDELRERAEMALFLNDASADQIKAFFAASPPVTGAGKAALAGAFLKDGNEPAAHGLVVSAWRDYQLNTAVENKILARYAAMLKPEDHRARIDRLLYPDDESATSAALRISKLLPADEQKKVAARVAVVKRGKNAGKLLDALPASTTAGDVGLLFNRIQWLRRKDRDEEAWKMLLDAPSEPDKLLDLENWWTERRVNCRAALDAGQPRIAYEIAVKHGPISGDAYVEAEFLAGWIALRFLNEPNTALGHLFAARTAAKSSKNIALAEYWLGRTALALGDTGSARLHFHVAARYPQYFYGQLGRQALDAKPANLEVTPTQPPTPADIQRFLARDSVRAIGVALASDMDRVTPQFFLALARTLKSPGEVVLLAELAKASGNQQISLRLAKIAFNRDLPVGDYALPIGVLPQFKSLLADRVDPALVHALSRQESEFNAGAKSPVGASGLMQLMPGTAKAIARQYKVKYEAAQLTNPTYNIQLGEAHLRELINSYSGSYFLALAAYNAGGGRVQEWMKAFGDPRNPKTDPIDWIERIPFTETREYVKKIMETLQLYRSRIAGSEKALQLVQDLNRGRPGGQSTAAAVVEVQAKSD
jgi:soluble lytic murein transglycosylase